MGFLYSQLFVKPAWPTKSFAGQTVIVTGSNVGLGMEAARHFVRLNAEKVILAVRNLEAGERAKQAIESSQGRRGVCEVWKLDLSSYDSVKAFAARANKLDRLDILVENAGIAVSEYRQFEGHESTVTVNFISTMLLALLMLPKLRDNGKKFPSSIPHLCIVTSEVHGWSKFKEGDANNIIAALDDKEAKNMGERYPTSKLLEVLIVRHIAPQVERSGVVLNMLNPGLCHSELSRHSGFSLWLVKALLARTTEMGSRTLVAAAAAGRESHGAYMHDGIPANGSLSKFVQSSKGQATQKKLWGELSEILENVEPGVTSMA